MTPVRKHITVSGDHVDEPLWPLWKSWCNLYPTSISQTFARRTKRFSIQALAEEKKSFG